jgi:GDP-L-fucose synthase
MSTQNYASPIAVPAPVPLNRGGKTFIAGHRGLVGAAILRRLQSEGFEKVVTRTHAELDLTDARAVDGFFAAERPEYVFLAAAKVGGILANATHPADFLRENLAIELNVIEAAYRYGTKRLLFLGSSCIYPKFAPQPMKEEHLLTGALEPTNEPYAIAKIAGIKLCQAYREQYGADFISAMPTNLYGPNDNFDPRNSHVLPALLRRFHEAKERGEPEVVVWGTGRPRREFLHVDDLADACLFLMDNYSGGETVNVGCGEDVSIRELAELVREVVGYEGRIAFDVTKPDGTPRKLLDVGKMRGLGWEAKIPLREGLEQTYRWFANTLPTQVRR